METSVKLTLIITCAVLIIALAGFIVYASNASTDRTVTVQGISNIKANPDLVSIYLTIETNASTTEEANSENSKKVESLQTELLRLGISKNKITSESFSTYPWQVWENKRYVNKGFKAVHVIKVELNSSETGNIGKVIDAASNTGAYIQYINFELSQEKQNEYKALALKQAGEDAATKAKAMAEGLGLKLGKPKSIVNQEYNYYPWRYYDYAADASYAENMQSVKQATTSIQPGDKDITASIQVIYTLR